MTPLVQSMTPSLRFAYKKEKGGRQREREGERKGKKGMCAIERCELRLLRSGVPFIDRLASHSETLRL